MRKMDEMEMSISLKAIKFAYAYTILFLAVWVVFDFVENGTVGLPCMLLISQNLILLSTQYFLLWKLGKNEK